MGEESGYFSLLANSRSCCHERVGGVDPDGTSVCMQDNQKDLENATEQLSEYLERDISSDMLQDIKQKVQDKYR